MNTQKARTDLANTLQWIHGKGWAPGTGGNFSIILERSPLTLLMSPSGVDKGAVLESDLIIVNSTGQVIEGTGKASAETLLHIALAENTGANAILHTHSVYNTILSSKHLKNGSIVISGLEMLKGLSGVTTHEHEEYIPVLENTQYCRSCQGASLCT